MEKVLEKSDVYEKLSKVQMELKAPKGQYNSFGNYRYRSCEDVLEALKPLLEKNELTLYITDEIIFVGNRYYIQATVRLIDLETNKYIETKALAREEDNKKGMDTSQITGSASSYARKYALNGMFAIDDNKDSDSTNKHGKDDPVAKNNSEKNSTKLNIENKWTNQNLTEKQINRLYAIGYKLGYDNKTVASYVYKKYSKEIKNLTKSEYDYICETLQEKINKNVINV